MKTINKHYKISGIINKNGFLRIQLNHIKYKDGTAIATDGYCLINGKAPEFTGLEGFLPVEQITAKTDSATIEKLLMQGIEYPETKTLLNLATDRKPKATIDLNYKLLLKITDSIGAFTNYEGRVTLELHGDGKPVVLKTKKDDHTEATALIMPLRG